MEYFLSSGRQRKSIVIDEREKLGRGASANVYRIKIGNKYHAAKIYHDDKSINLAKINAMLNEVPKECFIFKDGIEYPQFAWPQDVIYDDSGHPVGILLPLVDAAESFTLDHYYDKNLFKKLNSSEEAALSYKLEIAKNLAHIVATLHEMGHYIIDCKPQNIRVFKRSHLVTLIDCDGFSINAKGTRYPAEMLSTDYIAPEAQRRLSSPTTLTESQDRYALAVIIFQLLNQGTHPFQGIITDPAVSINTNDEKAAAGLYPHGQIANDKIKPRRESTHHLWDSKTRSMFDMAFTTGSPTARPAASEWASHFEELLLKKGIQRCKKVLNDVEHIRFRGMDCPACYLLSVPKFKALESSSISKRRQRSNTQTSSTGNLQSRQHYQPPTSGGQNSSWILWVIGIAFLLIFLFANLDNKPAPAAPTSPAAKIIELTNNLPTVRSDLANSEGFISVFFSDEMYITWVAGYASQAEANAGAQALCMKNANNGNCTNSLQGRSRCVNVAVGTTGFGASVGETEQEATHGAFSKCSEVRGNSSCEAQQAVCQLN
jgi:serine/threonine protein kinase